MWLGEEKEVHLGIERQKNRWKHQRKSERKRQLQEAVIWRQLETTIYERIKGRREIGGGDGRKNGRRRQR